MEIPIEIIELEDNSFHLLVTCQINGQHSGQLVVDTGASKTVIDKNFVDTYQQMQQNESEIHSRGLGEGSIQTEMVQLESFQLGELCISSFHCALIDLAGINEMYRQYCNREICGLLGSDFLLKYHGVIDYKNQILKLSEGNESCFSKD